MLTTLLEDSTCPCGNNANCETLAPTKSIADEFLHAATHAPHPIHVAASNDVSALVLFIGIALASCVFPDVFTDT